MRGFLLRLFAAALFCASIMSNAYSADWYVKASAKSGGDGSKSEPFDSLEAAESASDEGDTIFIRQSGKHHILDGQIVLKPGQKLIGLGPDVRNVPENAAGARITYSGSGGFGYPDGAVVQLSTDNEIANIHFKNYLFGAIVGIDVDVSGANIHNNLFTGGDSFDYAFIRFAVFLETSFDISGVSVTDNVIRNGEIVGGITAYQTGDSTGTYHFEGNHFDTIGLRPYTISSADTAYIKVDILNSSANNIGAAGEFSEFANSDSIVMQLSQSSKMDVVVDGYTFDNPGQFGSISNTGLELFLPGPGAGWLEEYWAIGAEVNLEIRNSSFSNAVTEAIQLLNTGINSTMNVEIRNTQVIDANPQQIASLPLEEPAIGGAISVLGQAGIDGNQNSLLIENCDIVGSTGYAVTVLDTVSGFSSIIDLGGGTLSSAGNNRFLNNASGDVELYKTEAVGRFNWWEELPPRVALGGGSTFVSDPVLVADPRP